MVGAGTLVALLLKGSGISFNWAVTIVGLWMVAYVVFGGMLATTGVQIIKAILLMGGTILLSILVMAHFHFSFAEFFNAITHVKDGDKVVNFLEPGLRHKPPYGALDLISLGLALIFGTAGLPHILVRFYTVPDAKTERVSVVWAMIIIGSFYIMTWFSSSRGLQCCARFTEIRSGSRISIGLRFRACILPGTERAKTRTVTFGLWAASTT